MQRVLSATSERNASQDRLSKNECKNVEMLNQANSSMATQIEILQSQNQLLREAIENLPAIISHIVAQQNKHEDANKEALADIKESDNESKDEHESDSKLIDLLFHWCFTSLFETKALGNINFIGLKSSLIECDEEAKYRERPNLRQNYDSSCSPKNDVWDKPDESPSSESKKTGKEGEFTNNDFDDGESESGSKNNNKSYHDGKRKDYIELDQKYVCSCYYQILILLN